MPLSVVLLQVEGVAGACKFKLSFEGCLEKCGLIVEMVQDNKLFHRVAQGYIYFDETVYEIDTHFVQLGTSTRLPKI